MLENPTVARKVVEKGLMAARARVAAKRHVNLLVVKMPSKYLAYRVN